MNGMFHKKGSVDRLYMKRREGGRGLISVEDCVRIEELNLSKQLRETPDLLICAAENLLNDGKPNEVSENGKEYKGRVRDERVLQKSMHGKYFRDIQEVASHMSCQWVISGYVPKKYDNRQPQMG